MTTLIIIAFLLGLSGYIRWYKRANEDDNEDKDDMERYEEFKRRIR